MRKIKEVLQLKYEAGLSHEKIARVCGLSKGVVGKYVQLAAAQGLEWPLPEGMDEQALAARLYPPRDSPVRYALPDCPAIHQELKRKGVTLQLLWAEYVGAHGSDAYRYTQFCQHYRDWRDLQKRSMRQSHRAGEKLFIDYAGNTVPVINPETGEYRNAQIFVAVLGASGYTYAEASWTQQLPDWIASNQRALRFIGGVPALLVPDNLRSAVTRPCRYAPEPNATYAEMARHYGTAILPARPFKPKDKAKAELGVLLVQRWILARLRHHRFFSLDALNAAIGDLLMDLNHRPFQKMPGTRHTLFETLDRPVLRPLPANPYVFAEWARVKPGVDYHIAFDKRLYSVPHTLVGRVLEVRATADTIEILDRGQRVASHSRQGYGRYVTLDAHMPKSHREHRQWSPGRFLTWARQIGMATRQIVQHQLHDRPHPEHGYRACLGLLSLARRYGHTRLEAACERALLIHSPSYASVSSILQKGLDQLPHDSHSPEQTELPLHINVRGSGYYQ